MNILVIDFEATCSNDSTISEAEMEIIEIGACFANEDGQIIDTFQSFIRPITNPTLTAFCQELTGIGQSDVDLAQTFSEEAPRFAQFVGQHSAQTAMWVSWGNYDKQQLERECARANIAAFVTMEHCDAKKEFAKRQQIGKRVGMRKALELVGLPPPRQHHRALEDAINIAQLLPWTIGDRRFRTNI